MSLHQVIYTSCMRGINGVNDGQQIFSYDAEFKDSNNDEVKNLFSYQPPMLEPGVVMTEELAVTMPKSFIFRRLSNGKCAFALNTYLGRDYMGSAGRFGNHLSHVVIADEVDVQNYPCEFYGSTFLRYRMEFEEVNNPNRPDYLPQPLLQRGFNVDIEAVVDFLSIQNRMEVFMNMLHALLSFGVDNKRVVICDESENIILWIAALQYSLPLNLAKRINFSTYDFDPSLSGSQVCGVVPNGTRFNSDSSRQHHVFDLFQDSCASFEKEDHYFDFIETALSFSYESLQAFHCFLEDGYNYPTADAKLYAAYHLYTLLSDGISGLSIDEIDKALHFAFEYELPASRTSMINHLFLQKEYLLKTDNDIFICVMNYIVSKDVSENSGNLDDAKSLLVERILSEFLKQGRSKELFLSFFRQVETLSKKGKFNISTELMKPQNRESLFAVMKDDISTWNITFIVKIVTTYIKETNIPVNESLLESELGQNLYGLIHAVYSKDFKNGSFFVSSILDEFATNCSNLVNMGLNLEGMLLDIPNGQNEADAMWNILGVMLVKNHYCNLVEAFKIFRHYQRYEQMYSIYDLAISSSTTLENIKKLFANHYDTFVQKDTLYAQQYSDRILYSYYSRLNILVGESARSAKLDLFNLIYSNKLKVSFTVDLVQDIVMNVPFESPSEANSQLIKKSLRFIRNDGGQSISGRLLLLVIGMVFDECRKSSHLSSAFDHLEQDITNRKAEMRGLSEQSVVRYFEWWLPNICELCSQRIEIEKVYNLFEMPDAIKVIFFNICAKTYLKQSKAESDYSVFCEFLGLVFSEGSVKIRQEIGKDLCKLSKQKLSALDELVRIGYSNDKNALRKWDEIKEIAEATNPLLNNLSSLFKSKKDKDSE